MFTHTLCVSVVDLIEKNAGDGVRSFYNHLGELQIEVEYMHIHCMMWSFSHILYACQHLRYLTAPPPSPPPHFLSPDNFLKEHLASLPVHCKRRHKRSRHASRQRHRKMSQQPKPSPSPALSAPLPRVRDGCSLTRVQCIHLPSHLSLKHVYAWWLLCHSCVIPGA